MRLLQATNNGGFKLQYFGNKATRPRYAILSHTWGRGADDEATFQDISSGAGETKEGYKKLQFACRQAKEHDLEYFWVDTCCIDKSSSGELNESINSMFQWYKESERCYVYLADVSVSTSDGPHIEWESAFRNSRWFTRGWTLQELLAPSRVEFFSREGKRLGDKSSLSAACQQVTGISAEALCQGKLDSYSIEERLGWIKTRETTREEDKAYSMLGICNVFMPMIYGEGADSAFRRLRSVIYGPSAVSAQAQSGAQERQRHTLMPFERNLQFVGREEELSKLESFLFNDIRSARAAIVGLGGMGKTQVAIELVHRTIDKRKDCSVFWLVATDTGTLLQSYQAAAEKLSIPGREDPKANIIQLVQTHLSQDGMGPWLLVFDNADDSDMWTRDSASTNRPSLIESLPRNSQGNILFTTRNRKIAVKLSHSKVVELKELQRDISMELLQTHLASLELTNKESSEALLEALTHLPLAIIQATSYINENGMQVADYLGLLQRQDETTIELLSEDFEDEGRYRSIQNPIAITWLITFERIKDHDSLAADYLSFLACIEPKAVPMTLLPRAASEKQHLEALGTLYAYSFVTKRPTSQSLDMHRLVHLAMRNWLSKNDMMRSQIEKTITQLETRFPGDHPVNRPLWRQYLPSVMSALQLPRMSHYEDARMKLAHRVGNCLFEDGRFREAEQLFQMVLKERKENLGDEHPETLDSMMNLSLAHIHQGRLVETEKLEMQVLEIRSRVLGEEHPHTLSIMSSLATTYRQQRRFAEAEQLQVQVLTVARRVLGEEHSDTLRAISNLASTYRVQKRFAEAEQLQVQVLAVVRRVLGEEHRVTLRTLADLAHIYKDQERFAEAEKLQVQVLAVRRRVLGEEHYETLSSMHHLAYTCHRQKRFAEAEQLYMQALAVKKRVHGMENPSTLHTIATLASIYCLHGKFAEAESLQVQVLTLRRRVLGEEARATLASMTHLAVTLKQLGRTSEAMAMIERCAELTARVLGADHRTTLNSMEWLRRWKRSQLEQAEVERSGDEQLGNKQPHDEHEQPSAIEGSTKKPSLGTKFLNRLSNLGRH